MTIQFPAVKLGGASSSRRTRYSSGSAWSPVSTALEIDIGSNVIWGTGPKDVWVGTSHFDGTTWKAAPTDPHLSLQAMWGRSPNDVWTTSSMGEVLHYDGAKWSLVTVLPSAAGIAGSEKDLVFVGLAGRNDRPKEALTRAAFSRYGDWTLRTCRGCRLGEPARWPRWSLPTSAGVA